MGIQRASEFATSVIEGPGGMVDQMDRGDMVIDHTSEMVLAAWYTLRCLANPDCEGSEVAIAAILEARAEKMRARVTA